MILTASYPAKIRQKYGCSHTGSRIFRPKKHKNTAVNTAIAGLLPDFREGSSYVVTAPDIILPKYNEDYIGAALVSIDGRNPKDICSG